MITSEEMAKFEQMFDELKFLLLSDVEDKYQIALTHIAKLVYIKNEGNQHKTAKELGITPRTVRTYLKEFNAKEPLLEMHLNMLATNKWFAELPLPEREECIQMVHDYYLEPKTIIDSHAPL